MTKAKILAFVVALLLIIAYVFLGPVVIDLTTQERLDNSFQKGDVIRPLDEFVFNEGRWKAYLIISGEDHYSFSKRNGVFMTENPSLLNQMKQDWVFHYSGADIATVQSKFLLYSADSLVFASRIIIDDHRSGLQSMNYGWLEAPDNQGFLSVFRNFDKGHLPFYWFTTY